MHEGEIFLANNTTIGSLAQGIQIIDVIAQSDTPLKFTDIQELTGISKSNLYKYLNTLIQLDLLYREQKRGYFSLGYKLLEYGSVAMQSTDFISRLTPYFKEISNITNMTTLLTVWINDAPVVTNIWNTNYGLNIGAQIGTKLPLMSAGGKIFAAYANALEVTNWIDQEYSAIEQFDMAAFQRELKQIREEQFAYSYEPLIKHVSSIGFPILNFNNELVGAISVVGFSEDIPNTLQSETVQQIIAISTEMSAIYGYKKRE